MHSNRFWTLLLFSIFSVSIWFSFDAAVLVYDYVSRSESVEVSRMKWTIEERGESAHLLRVEYEYTVEGKTFDGNEVLEGRPLLNHWAAEREMDKEREKDWKVWYPKGNPADGKLTRSFPMRQAVYAAILCGIAVYFVGLGRYVGKMGG